MPQDHRAAQRDIYIHDAKTDPSLHDTESTTTHDSVVKGDTAAGSVSQVTGDSGQNSSKQCKHAFVALASESQPGWIAVSRHKLGATVR